MMSGARRPAGGESGPRGRGKHGAPRSGPSGETPPSARTEPSSAARARAVLQRRRERPRRRQLRERPGERLAWWGRGGRGLDPRGNFPGASAGGGCGSQLRPLADPGPGASASGWEGLEPRLSGATILSLSHSSQKGSLTRLNSVDCCEDHGPWWDSNIFGGKKIGFLS
ncbi:unnamed protein product [Rangifer tarandus platyrhynchus]|uniref:Uncharacterized protein n=1 Tax=Rangifer tarandus platyrhynchus TaxID=3082113 RepID=A0AC59YKT2_RANTA